MKSHHQAKRGSDVKKLYYILETDYGIVVTGEGCYRPVRRGVIYKLYEYSSMRAVRRELERRKEARRAAEVAGIIAGTLVALHFLSRVARSVDPELARELEELREEILRIVNEGGDEEW